MSEGVETGEAHAHRKAHSLWRANGSNGRIAGRGSSCFAFASVHLALRRRVSPARGGRSLTPGQGFLGVFEDTLA